MNCLLKKVLPNWSYGLTLDICKDASTKRRIVCAESVGKDRKGSLLAVKVESL